MFPAGSGHASPPRRSVAVCLASIGRTFLPETFRGHGGYACGWQTQGVLLGIVVYWLEGEGEGALPVCEFFASTALTQALAWAEDRRRAGHRHISISTELEGSVGRPGVSAV